MERRQKVSVIQFLFVLLGVVASSLVLGKALSQSALEQIAAKSIVQLLELYLPAEVSHGEVAGTTLPDVSNTASTDSDTTAKESAVVSRIIDGDTIELSNGEVVRYIGINTPESKHPQKGVECYAREATEANNRLVLGKTVRLEQDVSTTDRYGRLLRYVWIGETLVNEELVAQGYAYASAYPPDVKYQERLSAAEAVAREQQAGLWAACLL